MRRLTTLLTLCLTALMLAACSDDNAQTEYSRFHAYFNYQKVMTAQPLYAALTGPGQFCAVYVSGRNLIFASPTNSYSDPLTSVAAYQRFQSINGFIVGMANIPDMSTAQLPLVAFDRACPNCYRNDGITRPLQLRENGVAYCSRCKRSYNLNNGGIITDGDNGVKLERYRIAYDGSNVVSVYN